MGKTANAHTDATLFEGTPPPDQNSYQKSFGDKMFDIGVYGGIGYLANAGISLATARYGVQKTGTQFAKMAERSQKQFEKLFRAIGSSPDTTIKHAKLANNILFLSSGGWLLIIPMKWLEDSKVDIIQSIDSAAGTGPQTAEAKQVQAEALYTGPRQSMFSLFVGRAISYVTTIAVALPFITETTRINANFNRFLYKQFGHKLGELREPLMIVDGKTTDMPAFVDAVSKETILAGTAAGLHYVSSKLLANAKHNIIKPPLVAPSPIAACANLNQPVSPAEREQPAAQIQEPRHDKQLAAAPAALAH